MEYVSGPQVKGPLFEVTVTEYEKGWGQRPCPEETKIFTNLADAEAYAKSCNTGSYEIFWRANIRKFG